MATDLSKSASPSEPRRITCICGVTFPENSVEGLKTHAECPRQRFINDKCPKCGNKDHYHVCAAEPRRDSIAEQIEKLKNKPDSEIDTSDIPEVKDWSGAIVGKFYREPRRDEREALEAVNEADVFGGTMPNGETKWCYAMKLVRAVLARASAAPLKQTGDVKELAREVAYTLAVESLSPVRRQILTIVFERFCKIYGFPDLLAASLPQPSAGQTEGK